MAGNVVIHQVHEDNPLENQVITLDVSRLSSGMYLIKFGDEHQSVSKKFIKK